MKIVWLSPYKPQKNDRTSTYYGDNVISLHAKETDLKSSRHFLALVRFLCYSSKITNAHLEYFDDAAVCMPNMKKIGFKKIVEIFACNCFLFQHRTPFHNSYVDS